MMTTPTGVKTLNLNDQPIVENEFKPIPGGTYEAEVGEATIQTPKEENQFNEKGELKTPYVAVDLKLFGNGLPETGRKLFPKAMLHLNLRPDANGVAMFQKENGLLAFGKALGTSFGNVTVLTAEATSPSGEQKTAEYLNPQEVVEAIKSLRGTRVSVRIAVKTETYKGKSSEKNELKKFLARQDA